MHLDSGANRLLLPWRSLVGAPEPQVAATHLNSWAIFSQRVFSFPVLLASLLAGGVFVAGRVFRVDPDLWWHIKIGDSILAAHRWPTTDTYSFTVSGQPWLAYEWLGDILLATVNRLAGLRGLDALLITIGSAVVLALYAFTATRTRNPKAAFVATAALSILAMLSFSLRPQMLGYLFLILTLIALERFRQGKQGLLWFLPILMLLWVNTHGSWIIGLGTIFVYWISGLVAFQKGSLEAKPWTANERRSIAWVFLLSLLTLPITPYGTRIAVSPFEFAFSLPLNVAHIQEWQSMPFNTLVGKIFLVLLLGIVIAQVTLRLTWRLEEFMLCLFGTMMACLHVRFILIFVPFVAPVLAIVLARWVPPYERIKDKFALNAALIFLVLAAMFHYFPSRQELDRRVAKSFPVSAVSYLQLHPVPEPMYNNYGFGGYLVWSRGPEHKVFIDGRGDVYERGGVLRDYMHISYLEPGALTVLQNYGIQSCLLQRDESLSVALYASPDWRRVYVDDVSALFVRIPASIKVK
jgi:hypothetical protein